MNQQNARDYIPLLEALADGELQKTTNLLEWVDVSETVFELPLEWYRRKPKSVKLYVATWFSGGKVNWNIAKDRKNLVASADECPGFKLNELDCGAPE